MIYIDVDPIILHLGPFMLHWYSLAVAGGVLVGILVALKEARRIGLPADRIFALALWAAVAGIIGTRLFHIIDRWEFYAANPGALLSFQQGGLAIWGGVALGVLVGVVYARMNRLPVGRTADIAVLGLLSGQIVGRLGCIVNGDAAGGPINLPWAFIYDHPNALIAPSLRGIPTHPYPLYEMLYNLVVLGVLWKMRTKALPPGFLFFTYLALYSLGRFFLTFVRQEQLIIGNLQQAQIVALLGLIVAVPALIWLARKPSPSAPAVGQPPLPG
ncbi:MAG: prolipoprotein diacylglyceryl transferase [Chloroflexota bacterium]|nr:prolipoprotein diacylglyceryl transferase [Chloroflexota bacterium]